MYRAAYAARSRSVRRSDRRTRAARRAARAAFRAGDRRPKLDFRNQEPRFMSEITCVRCGLQKLAVERPPFPGAIGQRIVEQICQDCWALWLRQQTMLINHYGLNVMDPQARTFLKQNMQGFLFKSGA